jgi:hypothetical protein
MQIFSLLADTLAEIQEQVGDDADNVCEEVLHLPPQWKL